MDCELGGVGRARGLRVLWHAGPARAARARDDCELPRTDEADCAACLRREPSPLILYARDARALTLALKRREVQRGRASPSRLNARLARRRRASARGGFTRAVRPQ